MAACSPLSNVRSIRHSASSPPQKCMLSLLCRRETIHGRLQDKRVKRSLESGEEDQKVAAMLLREQAGRHPCR